MNAQDFLTCPVDSIDFKDRLRLIGLLLENAALDHVLPLNETAIMVFAEDAVRPQEIRQTRAVALSPFQPTRLVILESTREITTAVTIERRRWFRKPIYEHRQEHQLLHSPASAWTVSGMWIGNMSALLAPAFPRAIPSSAFETGRCFTEHVVNHGQTITLDVSHALMGPANFRALLFGVPQK